MEAPEKIYLTSDEKNSYVFTQKRSDGKGIEYIRTDSFIEKAQSFFRQSHHLFHLDGLDLHNFVEDFKKYMEE